MDLSVGGAGAARELCRAAAVRFVDVAAGLDDLQLAQAERGHYLEQEPRPIREPSLAGVLFLAHDSASFVSGAVLVADGGHGLPEIWPSG